MKANYKYSDATNLYADLQRRIVDYIFAGYDEEENPSEQEIVLEFFNPKFGLFHMLNDNHAIYASFAVANKEPNRNDYVESTPNSRPKYETLYDTEIGYKQKLEVVKIFGKYGIEVVEIVKDYQFIERVLVLKKIKRNLK